MWAQHAGGDEPCFHTASAPGSLTACCSLNRQGLFSLPQGLLTSCFFAGWLLSSFYQGHSSDLESLFNCQFPRGHSQLCLLWCWDTAPPVFSSLSHFILLWAVSSPTILSRINSSLFIIFLYHSVCSPKRAANRLLHPVVLSAYYLRWVLRVRMNDCISKLKCCYFF